MPLGFGLQALGFIYLFIYFKERRKQAWISQGKSVVHSEQSPGQKLAFHIRGSGPADSVARAFPRRAGRPGRGLACTTVGLGQADCQIKEGGRPPLLSLGGPRADKEPSEGPPKSPGVVVST